MPTSPVKIFTLGNDNVSKKNFTQFIYSFNYWIVYTSIWPMIQKAPRVPSLIPAVTNFFSLKAPIVMFFSYGFRGISCKCKLIHIGRYIFCIAFCTTDCIPCPLFCNFFFKIIYLVYNFINNRWRGSSFCLCILLYSMSCSLLISSYINWLVLWAFRLLLSLLCYKNLP